MTIKDIVSNKKEVTIPDGAKSFADIKKDLAAAEEAKKQKAVEEEAKRDAMSNEFEWKFRVPDESKVLLEIEREILVKIAGTKDIYICPEQYHNEGDELQQRGLVTPYTVEVDALKTKTKRYEVEDDRFVLYENKQSVTDGGLVWKEVSIPITDNFYIQIDKDIEFDNGIEKIRKWEGTLIAHGGYKFDFNIDATTFATPADMSKALINIAGAQITFDNNKFKDIRNAMIELSKPKIVKTTQIFGWKDHNTYQAQSTIIGMNGVREKPGEVNLEDIAVASNLDILKISNADFIRVSKSIFNDLLNIHERYAIDCVVGHTFAAPLQNGILKSRLYTGGRVGLWLVGSSGCGKTYAARLFQNFFGDFGGGNQIFSWIGTPYSIQEGGWYFKDTLFVVDDFKKSNLMGSAREAVIMVLQGYADGTTRSRLSNMQLSSGKPIRGSILITGEDMLDDVGSIMGRFHHVNMEEKNKNRRAGLASMKMSHLYSGFMGRYLAWLLQDIARYKNAVKRIEALKEEFVGGVDSANIDRVAHSFAYNLYGFELFCKFGSANKIISDKKATEMMKTHKKNLFSHLGDQIKTVSNATVSEVFIETFTDGINSRSMHIHMVNNNIYDAGGEHIGEIIGEKKLNDGHLDYVGFDFGSDDPYLYLWGNEVWNAVNKSLREGDNHGLMNSKRNLINELIANDIMVPHNTSKGERMNTHSIKLYGKVHKTWRIRKSALGYNDIDVDEIFARAADEPEQECEWD